MMLSRIGHIWRFGTQPVAVAVCVVVWLTALMPVIVLFKSSGDDLSIGAYGALFLFVYATVFGQARQQILTAHGLAMPGVAAPLIAGLALSSAVLAGGSALIVSLAVGQGFSAILAFNTCLVLGALIFFRFPIAFYRVRSFRSVFAFLPLLPCVLAYLGVIPGVRDPWFGAVGWVIASILAISVIWLYRTRPDLRRLPFLDGISLSYILSQQPSTALGQRSSEADVKKANASPKRLKIPAAKPQSSIAVIRDFIGGEFPRTHYRKFIAVNFWVPALIYFCAVAWSSLIVGSGIHSNYSVIMIYISFSVWTGFIIPLHKLYMKSSNIESLALMPGLGSSAQVKKNLLQSIIFPILTKFALQSAAMLVTFLLCRYIFYRWRALPDSAQFLTFMFTYICLAMPAVFVQILRIVAGHQHHIAAEVVRATFPAILPLIAIAILATVHTGFNVSTGIAFLLFCIYLASMAVMIYSALREFQRRPHPFLPPREPTLPSDGRLAYFFNSGLFHPNSPRR